MVVSAIGTGARFGWTGVLSTRMVATKNHPEVLLLQYNATINFLEEKAKNH